MANELTVTIGSIIFNESIPTSIPASLYLLRQTAGLISGVPIGESNSPKQGNHGIISGLSHYRERVLRFRGELICASQSARKTAQLALEKELALAAMQSYSGDDGFITVKFTDEDGVLKQCTAKPSDRSIEWDILDNTDPSRREFDFEMIAEDPFLYSQTLNSETGDESFIGTNVALIDTDKLALPVGFVVQATIALTATNAGVVDAPPIITITGATTNPKVTNQTTGVFIHLDGLTLTTGETATINVNARTIVKNDGTDLSGYMTALSDWIFLQPGDNQISITDDTPDTLAADLQVQWRDTWI